MASIRRAQPSEAALLTDLALAAKAYWGYSPAFLASARAELTITAADISQHEIHVATLPLNNNDDDDRSTSSEEEEEVVGVYRLTPLQDGRRCDAELSYLWIRPSRIRQGLGRLLWEHAVRRAAALGLARFSLDADPHAEAFYVKMGADRCEENAPSKSVPGRTLPRFEVDVQRVLAAMKGEDEA
ncbi:acetyltransferase [Beauveria brongniartii RCEF 3172]|uniref:Acetyltransferase n=1 Tax=Beauveria brongniartii RCEF 3172 TaxID=1081107 RepID=A0A167DTE2_9HYPO|nr:acetyltransferase [Beauveria brongniartii RCEF 3172]